MAKRSTAGLVKYVKFLMDAGVMQRPLWLDALERCELLAIFVNTCLQHICLQQMCLVPPCSVPLTHFKSAACRVPPLATPKPGRRPPAIHFPEDDLVRAYYRRHPSASLEPVDLGSYEPNTARRFAARQLQLIEQGVPRKEARQRAEEEFKEAADGGIGVGGAVLARVQAEEEDHLKQAVKTYTERHGHKPMTAAARAPRRALPSRGEGLPRPPVRTAVNEGRGAA